MHRVTTALLASLISLTALHGENLAGFSASAGPAFPVRALRRLLGTGYAATGSIDFPLNDNISIVARGEYCRWQFSGETINTWLGASGGEMVSGAGGPFQAIPVTIGARVTFDGPLVRPYFGLSGGTCFLHWRFTGRPAATGLPAEGRSTWTEPAMNIEAGLIVAITGGLTLDLGGTYTACSNADDRVEPSNILGMKIAGFSTATFAAVQAGVRVAL